MPEKGIDHPANGPILQAPRALTGAGSGFYSPVMPAKQTKFIFVTGGVVSSVGKGIVAASIGALLENRGLELTLMKLDPYINVDPGTMSPFQHGEVFVTDDGAETDLDLGHYERFTSATMARKNSVTTGQVYDAVIQKERRGEYLGATIQVIPHVTNEIQDRIREAAKGVDAIIVEIGGTIGDIESLPFLEAVRQLRISLGPQNALSVHVTLVPYIAAAGEIKTKPTQHSVKALLEIGIQPDILVCRCDHPISTEHKKKIGLFCNLPVDNVIAAQDASSIYEVPLNLKAEGLDDRIAELLNIWSRAPRLTKWKKVADTVREPTKGTVTIAMVGKYVHLRDAYKSLHEALIHGGLASQSRVDIRYVDSEEVEQKGAEALLAGAHGILVPGGFGQRGTEGKIAAIRWAREKKVPFFGICLGMQMAVVEFARDVCGLEKANSSEFDEKSPHKVVDLMETQKGVTSKGGTMRLGAWPCKLVADTRARQAYGETEISERHRHRFEVNNAYRDRLSEKGLVLSGLSPDGHLVEMVELPHHPWFVACQFHPEFKSRPMAPHPLFARFVAAALAHRGPLNPA
jgi:CTP synthase